MDMDDIGLSKGFQETGISNEPIQVGAAMKEGYQIHEQGVLSALISIYLRQVIGDVKTAMYFHSLKVALHHCGNYDSKRPTLSSQVLFLC